MLFLVSFLFIRMINFDVKILFFSSFPPQADKTQTVKDDTQKQHTP